MKYPSDMKTRHGKAKNYVEGSMCAFGITVTLCAILAWLIKNGNINKELSKYGGMVIPALSSYIGSLLSIKKSEPSQWYAPLVIGCIYEAIILLASTLLFGVGLKGAIPTGIMVLCGAGVALIMHNPQKGGKRKGIVKKAKRKYA